jgi:beta-mannosidase
MTVGPYRPIRLIAYTARIQSVDIGAVLSSDLHPSVTGSVTSTGDLGMIKHVLVRLERLGGKRPAILEETVKLDEKLHWDLTGKVDLWYPVGYGPQPLYTLRVSLVDKVGLFLASPSNSHIDE